ncbi:class I SAM-dependent methyltransferase [Pseudonocardia nigra]|uniref:class I SAM-dependent methyltransferase n=1 Tax=Pseudonocardia nigra TaxID=1921578 RepID=UPI001C5D2476|nr:class I SAM-dependent methyltransferase [Pseudonocardia nigra]
MADREERFRVVADVVRWSLARTGDAGRPARIVDVGCGPGSLSSRLARELPGAEIVGVDVDPLLLGLAAESGVRVVRADITDPAWPDALGLAGPWDVVVSSTALHWLAPAPLAELYRTVAGRLRPGGVFVDADNRPLDGDVAADLGRWVRDARAERAGVTGNEDWRSWWDAVLADSDLGPLVDARSEASIAHSSENEQSVGEHASMLRAAGFGTAVPVWQCGDDIVLVGVR